MATTPVYLASRSPRRRALLEQLQVRCTPVPADIEEIPEAGETPRAFVTRMAEAKARRAGELLGGKPPGIVIGADTAVVLDGCILGKPRNAAHARRQLGALAGRRHDVLSAVAMLAPGARIARLSESQVWLRDLDASELARYCATGEPLDKAGGYAIQGLAAVFVRRLEGSYSGVMGLPLYETAEMFAELGVEVIQPG